MKDPQRSRKGKKLRAAVRAEAVRVSAERAEAQREAEQAVKQEAAKREAAKAHQNADQARFEPRVGQANDSQGTERS